MGVPGLTKFVDKNIHLLKDTKLRKTDVIIDGNNLLHFLYYHYQVPHIYGGDYHVFSRCCETFFETLEKCDVTSFVVFDGAYHPEGLKFSSSLKRTSSRLINALEIMKGGSSRVLPLLSLEVFIEVLNKLNINFVMCSFEADYHIASLAAYKKCPVLTNDSDFFIFDLPGGVILLDYLSVEIETDGSGHYLNVQKFYIKDLLTWMGITDVQMMPLFATVIGTDVIDSHIFEHFRKTVTKARSKKHKNLVKSKLFALMKWLATKQTYKATVDEIILSFSHDKQHTARELIVKSVATYTTGETCLKTFFENPDASFSHFETLSFVNEDFCSEWFRKAVHAGKLSPRISNVFSCQRCILQPQVECIKEVSSHLCSLPVRQLTYGILLKSRQSDKQKAVSTVKEYDRVGGKIVKKVINITTKLKNNLDVPALNELPLLGKITRLAVILDLFQENDKWFLTFPEDERLFLAVFTFWVVGARPRATKCQVLSLLVCFFAPNILKSLVDRDDQILLNYPTVESTISNHLENTKSRKRYFDSVNVHCFSQFHSCLLSFDDLNNLLMLPFQAVTMTRMFNATSLIYTCHHLESSTQNLTEMLKELSSDDALVNKITDIAKKFNTHVGEVDSDLLSCDGVLPVQQSKCQKKSKNKSQSKCGQKQQCETTSLPREALTDQNVFYDVDVENQFKTLNIANC